MCSADREGCPRSRLAEYNSHVGVSVDGRVMKFSFLPLMLEENKNCIIYGLLNSFKANNTAYAICAVHQDRQTRDTRVVKNHKMAPVARNRKRTSLSWLYLYKNTTHFSQPYPQANTRAKLDNKYSIETAIYSYHLEFIVTIFWVDAFKILSTLTVKCLYRESLLSMTHLSAH